MSKAFTFLFILLVLGKAGLQTYSVKYVPAPNFSHRTYGGVYELGLISTDTELEVNVNFPNPTGANPTTFTLLVLDSTNTALATQPGNFSTTAITVPTSPGSIQPRIGTLLATNTYKLSFTPNIMQSLQIMKITIKLGGSIAYRIVDVLKRHSIYYVYYSKATNITLTNLDATTPRIVVYSSHPSNNFTIGGFVFQQNVASAVVTIPSAGFYAIRFRDNTASTT